MKNTYTSYYLDSPLITGRIFDIFVPEETSCDTSLFIVHGGGWRAGTRTSFHGIMEAFNNQGVLCASTDYRMAGVHALEQLADIRESYDRFVTFLKDNNRPLKIAVYGESAGAHLASLLLCAEPGECGEKVNLKNEWVKPVKGILQSTPAQFTPWEDIFPQIWVSMVDIVGESYEKNPEAFEKQSLKNYIRKNNPVLYFAEAENEHMFPTELNQKLLEKQNKMGIPSRMKVYRHMEHGFFYALNRPQQKEFFQDILDFLKK